MDDDVIGRHASARGLGDHLLNHLPQPRPRLSLRPPRRSPLPTLPGRVLEPRRCELVEAEPGLGLPSSSPSRGPPLSPRSKCLWPQAPR